MEERDNFPSRLHGACRESSAKDGFFIFLSSLYFIYFFFGATHRFPQSTLLITRSFSSRVLSVVRVPAKSSRRHSSNSRITLRNALNLYSSRSCETSKARGPHFESLKKFHVTTLNIEIGMFIMVQGNQSSPLFRNINLQNRAEKRKMEGNKATESSAIFSPSIATFNIAKVSSLLETQRQISSQVDWERNEVRNEIYTHHVQSLPNATPFPQHQGNFPYHRILHRNNRLEEAFIVDFAKLQMHVGTGKDPFHRAILRREASVPAWNIVGNFPVLNFYPNALQSVAV